jgi:aldehyde:ferredoxin oxidoreductase
MDKQQICFISLDRKEIKKIDIVPELRSRFLGGRGINIYLLYTNTSSRTTALDPNNPLIIGAGLLSGTSVPTGARCSISGKSPETGLLGDSNIGGFFAYQLKKSGYDHLLIKGQAQAPIYLYIEDGQVQIMDASNLWGKDTLETLHLIQELHGKASQSLVIGPAGENLVRFATVRHGKKNTAGRTGLGCLMGSKKIKAIVVKGGRAPALKHPEEFARYAGELRQLIKDTRTTEVLHRYGTPFLYDLHNLRGVLRTLNAQFNQFKDGRGLRSSQLRKYYTHSSGCFSCPIKCQHSYTVPDKGQGELSGHGLEYGVIGALGPICGLNNLESIFRISDLLNRYGLDASSTGNLIAWVMELFQRGILTAAETGGLSLDWGDEETITELIKQIVERRGLGNILADGGKAASEKFGKESQKYLIWSKYLPQSDSVDLRAFRGFALGVATSTRGADHLRSRPTMEALNLTNEELQSVYGRNVPNDPTSYREKAFMVWWSEINFALGDALGVCRFAQKFNNINHMGIEEFSKLIYLATGMSYSVEELIQVGERIITLERMFLQREGIDRRSDTLPDRYFDEPMTSGPFTGQKLDRAAFSQMLDDYYKIHGWDSVTGNPTEKTVRDLGLDTVAKGEELL